MLAALADVPPPAAAAGRWTPATSCAPRSPACAPTSSCWTGAATSTPTTERRLLTDTATVELDELSELVAELVDLATEQRADALDREAVALGALVEAAVERARRRTGRVVDVPLDGAGDRSAACRRCSPRAVSQPARQRRQVQPGRVADQVDVVGHDASTVADRGPGHRPRRPGPGLRPLLPRRHRPHAARLRAGAGHRPPGRHRARGDGDRRRAPPAAAPASPCSSRPTTT